MLKNAPIIFRNRHTHLHNIVPHVTQQSYSHVHLHHDRQYAYTTLCLTGSAHFPPHVLRHNAPPQPSSCKRSYTSAIIRDGTSTDRPAPRSKKKTVVTPTLEKPIEETPLAPPPNHSVLHPPKQAPSVWQIFFTDWLQRQRDERGGEDQKLNVAQEAKTAARAYNNLPDEDREDLATRAKVLKENYERELAVWKRGLTPADVERENAFRTAQRKSGKSRKKNINDPNAPKRPLSPYFLYLQAIRADPHMVKDVFGDVTSPTQQSVVAAAKWRSMSEVEKRPYFERANNAKMLYEAERELYENKESSNKGSPGNSFVIYSGVDSPSSVTEQKDGISGIVMAKHGS